MIKVAGYGLSVRSRLVVEGKGWLSNDFNFRVWNWYGVTIWCCEWWWWWWWWLWWWMKCDDDCYSYDRDDDIKRLKAWIFIAVLSEHKKKMYGYVNAMFSPNQHNSYIRILIKCLWLHNVFIWTLSFVVCHLDIWLYVLRTNAHKVERGMAKYILNDTVITNDMHR